MLDDAKVTDCNETPVATVIAEAIKTVTLVSQHSSSCSSYTNDSGTFAESIQQAFASDCSNVLLAAAVQQ
jgi:hypothetical protein